MRPGDFEVEVDRRREHLDGVVASDVTEPQRTLAALRSYRPAATFDAPRTDA
jgi:hypothetical protein